MGRYSENTGSGNFVPAPVGTHVARCIRIIDIGTQHDEVMGKPQVRLRHIVVFELPNEMVPTSEGERPAIASRFYTTSLHEKSNWRFDLEAWYGREFTEEQLARFDNNEVLGRPCMLSIVGKDGGGSKIASVAALPRGTEVPPAVHPLVSFWIDEWDDHVFTNVLTDGIRKLIMKSDEYKARQRGVRPASRQAAPGENLSWESQNDVQVAVNPRQAQPLDGRAKADEIIQQYQVVDLQAALKACGIAGVYETVKASLDESRLHQICQWLETYATKMGE